MENSLDAIAAGRLNWHQYLTGWNRDYFNPAIEQAQKKASEGEKKPTFPTKKESQLKTNLKCPICNSFLSEKTYKKNGNLKKMLICLKKQADPEHEVVFFQSKGKWWNPLLGELENQTNENN